MVFLKPGYLLSSIFLILAVTTPSVWGEQSEVDQSHGTEFWWSQWSRFSPCSRSCGVGVKQRYRICYRSGATIKPVNSSNCQGRSNDYDVCNRQQCPDGARDFRSLQCAYFNGISHRRRQHTWRPFITGPVTTRGRVSMNPCALMCSAVGMAGLVVKFSSRVVDGTRCGLNQEEICVQGQCMKIGCDWKLGAEAKVDKCGVCNGNGKTCDVTSGVVEKILQPGYEVLMKLPVGSRNIALTLANDNSATIALKTAQGIHFLTDAGRSKRVTLVSKQIGGAVFHFDPMNGTPITIKAKGPIRNIITVLGFARETNTPISFKYEYMDKQNVSWKPRPLTDRNEPSSDWQTLLYRHLVAMKGFVSPRRRTFNRNNAGNNVIDTSVSNFRHIKSRRKHSDTANVSSIDTYRKNMVEATADDNNLRVPIPREKPVPKYVSETRNARRFNVKSQPIGSTFVHGRKPTEHPYDRNLAIGISIRRRTHYPSPDDGPKAAAARIRISNRHGYNWQQNKITPCSATCSVGTQISFFSCFHRNGLKVNDSLCDEDSRPNPKYHVCGRNRCQPRWVTGLWSQCSRTCGGGEQVRSVRCWQMLAPGFDSTVHEYRCTRSSKPASSRSCADVPCGPQWEVSEWEECSSYCGNGGQMRHVKCSTGNDVCDISRKPLVRRMCKLTACSGFWYTESWSSCTGPCGRGVRRRHVGCRDSLGRRLSNKYCDADIKPLTRVACGTTLYCPPSWIPQPWGQCILSCGQGVMTRTVVCGSVVGGKFRMQSDNNCKRLPEPKITVACTNRKCAAQWFFTEWSECSETCGTAAVRTRSVTCYLDNQFSEDCDESDKPATEEHCRLPACQKINNDNSCVDNLQTCKLLVDSLCRQPYYMSQCCATCRRK